MLTGVVPHATKTKEVDVEKIAMSSAECGREIVKLLGIFPMSDEHIARIAKSSKNCGELLKTLHMLEAFETHLEELNKKKKTLN